MKAKVYGWHFAGEKLRDGRDIPADGEWLEHTGPIQMCKYGLHGSRTPAEALGYAPGATLCYCEFHGIESEDKDKFVARRRKIVARLDADEILRYFARMQALSVVHLWDAPDVVLDYLMTGDEEFRAAARAAAWYAAWYAAGAAAGAAARDAAGAAAGAAARDAAGAAAGAAAGDEFNILIYECFEGVMRRNK